MPGAPSYVETSVCDVLPGGPLALDGTLITQYNEFVAPAPGTTITTVDTKYNLYDDGGQVLCDLDENGNITKRYVYANGKHVAMDLPGNRDYMTNGGFEYGNFEYPLTPWYKWAPNDQTPNVNWTMVNDVNRTGTYSLKGTAFTATDIQNYAQNVGLPAVPFVVSCYMKAQDLTGGCRIIVECCSGDYSTYITGINSNLQTGTFDWKLVSIPVTQLPAGTGAIKVTLQRLNGTGTVWVDDVRCEEGVSRKEDKTYYYHCDYLNSPRAMTDASGNVVWRQDYYAFGADYNTTATGNTHKFTGHVKDDATGQYYAKARYFTTGLGRWSQPEPLLQGVPNKAFLANPQKLNPYVYCLNNPIKYVDADGCEPNKSQATTWETAKGIVGSKSLQELRYVSGQNTGDAVGPFGGDKGARYIYTEKGGWIDLGHFFQVGAGMQKEGGLTGIKKTLASLVMGEVKNKVMQKTTEVEESQTGETKWSYEDGPSNWLGAVFYLKYYTDDAHLAEALDKFFKDYRATDPQNAPNWKAMQKKPQKEKNFPENKSLDPVYTK